LIYEGILVPTRERVQALIDLVERGRYVEAIEQFYHDDASMQENLDPSRRGRETLIKGERRVIEAHRSIRTRPVRTFMVEGDRAVINWVFDFVDHEGRAYTQDELAFQLWRGDRIIEERFYYDPAQRTRRTPLG
jgi:ketosteroid isomerase-like protein